MCGIKIQDIITVMFFTAILYVSIFVESNQCVSPVRAKKTPASSISCFALNPLFTPYSMLGVWWAQHLSWKKRAFFLQHQVRQPLSPNIDLGVEGVGFGVLMCFV